MRIAQLKFWRKVDLFMSGFKILTFRSFEPTEISGLKMWLDASTVIQNDNTSVSAWLDKSGNEAHVYQSTSAAQPTLQTTEQNNLNVIRFDGVDDVLNLTAPFDTLPTSVAIVNSTAMSRTGNYLSASCDSQSPKLIVYKKNGTVYNKIGDFSGITSGSVAQQSWSSDDTYLAVCSSFSIYIHIYKRSGDTFTKLSNPATLPNATMASCHFSSDSTYLGVSGTNTEKMFIYKRSGDTFTKLTDPATLPTGTLSRNIRFSTNDTYLAVSSNASPYIQFYSRSGDTFTKLTDPATLPTTEVLSLDWYDDTTCAVSGSGGTVRVYQYDAGIGYFKQITTFTSGVGTVYSIRFSRSKNYVAIGGTTSPYVKVYSVTGSGSTYTALSDPDSLPLGSGSGTSWGLNDENLFVGHANSPFIQGYSFNGTTLTNLNKLDIFRNVSEGTIFTVIKYTANSTAQTAIQFMRGGANTWGSRVKFDMTTGNKYQASGRRLDADSSVTVASTDSTGSFAIHAAVFDWANSDLYQYLNGAINGSTTSFSTNGNTSDTDSVIVKIGAMDVTSAAFLAGDIAEIVVFNRKLTANELTNMHNYLSKKWGVTLA